MARSQLNRDMIDEDSPTRHGCHEDALIAGLPHEVVLSIFARLPCVHYPRLRCVSHAWNDAFRSSDCIVSYRRALGMLEAWPLVRIRRENKPCRWYAIDPHCLSSHRIPSPASIHIENTAGSESSIFATYRYDMCKLLHFHSFDASLMQWQHSQVPAMHARRSVFSSAILDGYWYVVGGHAMSVERIHIGNPSMLSSWECMPDMHHSRQCAQVLSRQGCLYVLGGRRELYNENTVIYSGEVWNPRTEEWTLVPELWPVEVFGDHASHQVAMAVVMGALFALKKLSRELLCYHDNRQVWVNLGQVPLESDKQFHKLLGVASELWLFSCGGRDIYMFNVASLCGSLSNTPPNLSWRTSRFEFDGKMDVFEESVVLM